MKLFTCCCFAAALAAAAADYTAAQFELTPAARLESAAGKTILRLVKPNKVHPLHRAPDAVLKLKIEKTGTYEFTVAVYTQDTGSDSIYYQFDQGKVRELHCGFPKTGVPYKLDPVKLTVGEHVLNLYCREPNFGVGKVSVNPVKAAPKRFSIPGKPGPDNTYMVTAIPGNYYVRVFASVKTAGPQQDAMITIGKSVPMKRRIIFPTYTENSYEVERVKLGETPVAIRIRVNPEVTIHKLEFRPVPKKLPAAAANYKPALVPRPDRPRVFVNQELLTMLQSRNKQGDGADAWKIIHRIATRPYQFNPAPDKEVMWDSKLVMALRCKAFYYLMTGDKDIGREAVELAIRYFNVVNFGNGQDICRRTGAAIQSASMVYDWCYKLMTDAERKQLIDRFLWQAESMEIGWPPFLESINTGHGNEAQVNKHLLAMAIAVYNEDPVPWQYCSYLLLEQARPMKSYLYKSGFHYEGIAYANVRYNADITAALLLQRGCGWTQYEPYVGRIPYAWFHFRTPDGQFLSMGDDYMLSSRYPGDPETYLIANALWPDGKLKDEYMKYYRNSSLKFSDPVLFLLTMNPFQKTDPKRDDLALAKYYKDPVSLMSARTGWNMGIASDDVVVSMTGAGLFHRSHQHLDAGNFQLYYRGLLTSDIGQYRYFGKPYTRNFAKTSMAHSVMRFIDPAQKTTRMGNGVEITSGTQEGAPGGPQYIEDIRNRYEHYSRGRVMSVSENPQSPYIQLDLAKSYPNRVKKYIRTMVFLAAEKPALLVYDELETANMNVTPVWQITTLDAPENAGNGVLTVDHKLCGLPSRLTIRTLLPKAPRVNILTDKAAHLVEGVQYVPPFPNRPEAHGSRTEISLPGAERFLHVLQPTPGTDAAPVKVQEKGRTLVVTSDGWSVTLIPGEAPSVKVTKPAKPLPPPRDTVYLDGKIIGKIVNGRTMLDKHPQASGLTVDAAAKRLNSKLTRDPETGSAFLETRPVPAKFSEVTVSGGSLADFDELLANTTGNFVGRGKTVCTAVLIKPETWSAVSIRYPHGADRYAFLKIELAADGKTFKTVFDGRSGGKTRDFEDFKFPAQTVRAVRFTFNGNSDNQMTTINGIRFK